MAKRRRGIGDIEYHVFGKKRPVAGSSVTTSDFLAAVHDLHPTATIDQLQAILADRSQWLPNLDVLAILDAHIEAGYGSYISHWR